MYDGVGVKTPMLTADFHVSIAGAVIPEKRIVFFGVIDVFCHPDLILVSDGSVCRSVSWINHCVVFDIFIEKVFLRNIANEIFLGKVPIVIVTDIKFSGKGITRKTGVVYDAFLVAEFVLLCSWGFPSEQGANVIFASIFANGFIRIAIVRSEYVKV